MRNSTTFLSKFYKIVVNAIIAYEKLAVACQYPRISVRGGIEVFWVGVGIGLKPTGKKKQMLWDLNSLYMNGQSHLMGKMMSRISDVREGGYSYSYGLIDNIVGQN